MKLEKAEISGTTKLPTNPLPKDTMEINFQAI
jgi:hypothetical protein